jgi:hypothetical protein
MAKMRVVITPDGDVRFMIVDGSFEEGKKEIAKLVAGLGGAGLTVTPTSEIEQHRHGPGETQTHVAHN